MDAALKHHIAAALSTRLGANSIESYRYRIERFCEAAKVKSIRQLGALKTKDVQAIVRQMYSEFSVATVRQTVVCMRRVFKHLRREELLDNDPLKDIELESADNVPDWNVLQPGESQQLVNACTHPRDRAILLAILHQGWRASELCSIQWGELQVDRDGDTVVKFIGKGGKPAIQAVHQEVLDAARMWAKKFTASSDPFIAEKFESGRAKALNRFMVNRIVKKWVKRVLKRKVTPHGLRATFVSELVARRGIEVARQLARHRSISTTQRYSRWTYTKDEERQGLVKK